MDELAREFDNILTADDLKAKSFNLKPGNSSGKGEPAKTVTTDIDAVIAKLQTLIKGLELLRAQL